MERTPHLPAVTPFGPIRAPVGNVIPLDLKRVAKAMGDEEMQAALEQRPNLYDALEERERTARVIADERRDRRHFLLQAIVHWACIGVALATAAYFALEFAR